MSGDVALVDSGDGAISRLVRTASTLFASPDFRPTALVGGLAVTVRLATVHRATNDVDTVSEGEGPRDLALQYLGDADAAAANRIEIDGVKVDVMATWPLPSTSAELPDGRHDPGTGHLQAPCDLRPAWIGLDEAGERRARSRPDSPLVH